ncbi:hypothetical protein [Streptomyces sp. enrichment culture]|uniref:hypothetical protein n=1 Tax=Streptomyces sp. enrichment culture TaxID=1795815 RepID=UPI003F55E45A
MRHEAGSEFVDLGHRLAVICAEIAPVVEQVTELALPDQMVIRTMTVPDWQQAHRQRTGRRLFAEFEELRPTSDEKHQAGERRRVLLKFQSLFWPTLPAESVEFVSGCPELVVLPEALRHAGRLDDDPALYRICAHELTRLAQYEASGGAVWRVPDTFFPQLRGIQGRDFGALVEGHACWADQQVTSALFGAPVSTDEPCACASLRYRVLHTSPLRMASVAGQRTATATVAQLIRLEGLGFFNRVWKDLTLTPLVSDTTADAWHQRFRR